MTIIFKPLCNIVKNVFFFKLKSNIQIINPIKCNQLKEEEKIVPMIFLRYSPKCHSYNRKILN